MRASAEKDGAFWVFYGEREISHITTAADDDEGWADIIIVLSGDPERAASLLTDENGVVVTARIHGPIKIREAIPT